MSTDPEDAGRQKDDIPEDEASAGIPPESSEGVDAENREGRKALSREDIYARLGAVDDPEDEDSETPAPQVEDQESAGQAPEADDDATEPPGDDQEQPPVDADAGDTPAGDDNHKYLGRVPDDEWKSLPPQTRERINALRADRKARIAEVEQYKQREPIAKYGEAVLSWAEQNRVSDEDMNVLLSIGARLQQGGEVAMQEALRIAQHYGYRPEAARAQAPDPLPDWLQQKVDDLEITEEAAKEIAARISEQAPPSPPQQQPVNPVMPPAEEALLNEGKQLLATAQAEASQRYGSQWANMWPQVQREMLKEKGADPRTWGVLFKKSLEIVEERNKRASAKGRINQDLAPGSTQAQSQPDPQNLTGRDRLYAMYTRARPGS